MSKKSLNKLFEAVTPYKYDDPLKRDERDALETIIHVDEKIKILLKCYFDESQSNKLRVMFSKMDPAKPTFSGSYIPNLNLGSNHAFRLMETIRKIIEEWAKKWGNKIDRISFDSIGIPKKTKQLTDLFLKTVKKSSPKSFATTSRVKGARYGGSGNYGIQINLREFNRILVSKMLNEHFSTSSYDFNIKDSNPSEINANIIVKPNMVGSDTPKPDIIINLKGSYFPIPKELSVRFYIQSPGTVLPYKELNLGANHAHRLMFTIRDIILNWAEENKIDLDSILFSSSGEDKKSVQRTNLYFRHIKKVFPNAKIKKVANKTYSVELKEFIRQVDSKMLIENFNIPVYKDTPIDKDLFALITDIHITDKIFIRLRAYYFNNDNSLRVIFSVHGSKTTSYGELNLGANHAYRLMYTIKELIMDWISDYNLDVKEINFSSSGDEKKAAQRTNLYFRHIKKSFPNAKLNKLHDGSVKVTLDEFINESFPLLEDMTPYDVDNISMSHSILTADINVNKSTNIDLICNKMGDTLMVSFATLDVDPDKMFDKLNLGVQHAFKLMYTIKKLIIDWIEKYDIKFKNVMFLLSGDDKEIRQRTNFYYRFIKKAFPNAKITNPGSIIPKVSLSEFINEPFPLLEDMSSYSYDIDQNDESKYGIEAKIKVNKNVKIKMSCFNIGNNLSISFHVLNDNNNKYAELNLGVQHAFKLMYTIKEIIVNWISKYNINPIRIGFIPTGFLKKSNQRTNLYYRFIKKVFPNAKITSEPYSAKSTISLNEFINESFPLLEDMTPYPYEPIIQTVSSTRATIHINKDIDIVLNCYSTMDPMRYKNPVISVDFHIEGNVASLRYGELNLGAQHAHRLMYTIKQIIMDWIKKYDIKADAISFSTSGDGKKSHQRAYLYNRYIKKVFPNAKMLSKGHKHTVSLT